MFGSIVGIVTPSCASSGTGAIRQMKDSGSLIVTSPLIMAQRCLTPPPTFCHCDRVFHGPLFLIFVLVVVVTRPPRLEWVIQQVENDRRGRTGSRPYLSTTHCTERWNWKVHCGGLSVPESRREQESSRIVDISDDHLPAASVPSSHNARMLDQSCNICDPSVVVLVPWACA